MNVSRGGGVRMECVRIGGGIGWIGSRKVKGLGRGQVKSNDCIIVCIVKGPQPSGCGRFTLVVQIMSVLN